MLTQQELKQQALQDTALEFITAVAAIRGVAATMQLPLDRATFANNSGYWYRSANPGEPGTLTMALFKSILFTYTPPDKPDGTPSNFLQEQFDMGISLSNPLVTVLNISSLTGLPLTVQNVPPPPSPPPPPTDMTPPANPIGDPIAGRPGLFAPAGGDQLPVSSIRVIDGATYIKVSLPLGAGFSTVAWKLVS